MRPWLVAAILAACAHPDAGRPPVARIAVAPAAIPAHDGFTTDVTIDASESADPVDDPEATMPLEYFWRIEDDEAMFVSGKRTSMAATIRLAGERPARIELTVTDADGDRGTDTLAIQLTID